MIYIAKKDISILDKVIFWEGEEILVEDNLVTKDSDGIKISLPLSDFGSDIYPKPSTIGVKLEELNQSDEEVRTWRLQLDVKTTRSKAIVIEKFLRESLESMI